MTLQKNKDDIVIDFPNDAIIECFFGYEEKEDGSLANKTEPSLVLAVKPTISYTYDQTIHEIVEHPIESGQELVRNSIKLIRGIEDEMTHMVN